MSASIHRTIARFLARLNPILWEGPAPHVPRVHESYEGFGPSADPWALRRETIAGLAGALPPADLYTLALTDAMLHEVVSLAHEAHTIGGELGGERRRRAAQMLTDFIELCPRWPKWPPRGWPPRRDPEWLREEMAGPQVYLAASRILFAADVVTDAAVKEALFAAGERLADMAIAKGEREAFTAHVRGAIAT